MKRRGLVLFKWLDRRGKAFEPEKPQSHIYRIFSLIQCDDCCVFCSSQSRRGFSPQLDSPQASHHFTSLLRNHINLMIQSVLRFYIIIDYKRDKENIYTINKVNSERLKSFVFSDRHVVLFTSGRMRNQIYSDVTGQQIFFYHPPGKNFTSYCKWQTHVVVCW